MSGFEEEAPPPVITVAADASSVEEGSPAEFTLTRVGDITVEIDIPYTVTQTGGNMLPSGISSPITGMATLAAEAETVKVSVATDNDSSDDDIATLMIELDPPGMDAGFSLGSSTSASITVTDNDGEPTVSIAAATGTVTEGGNLEFTVTVSPVSGKDITVPYRVEGSGTANQASSADFSDSESGTLAIPASAPTGTITIATVDDDLEEEDETLTVILLDTSDLSNADLSDTPSELSADGTITDNDKPEVSVAWEDSAPVAEGGSLEFAFTLTPASAREVRVPFTVAGGGAHQAGSDDYTTPVASEVVFAPGDITKTVTINTINDAEDEPDEGITVALGSSLSNAVPAANTASRSATGTIADNDAPEFTVADASGSEGGAVEFTVTKSMASWQSITVGWAATSETGDTATAGTDYISATSGTLTFAPASTEETFEVATMQNTALDGSRTFTVTLSSVMPSGAATLSLPPTATGTIIDDEAPTFSVSVPDVTEGESSTSTMTFTVTMSSTWDQTVTVGYEITGGTATAGEDFLAQSSTGTLTYAAAGNGSPGDTEQTVEVEVVGDRSVEPDETVTLSLSNVMGGAQVSQTDWTGTILSDDFELEGITATPSSVDEPDTGTAFISFEVTLAGAWTREVAVAYRLGGGTATLGADFTDATTRDDGTPAAGQLVFPRGVSERTIRVAVNPDIADEGDETVVLEIRKLPPTESMPGVAGELLSIAGAQSGPARAEATIAQPQQAPGASAPAIVSVQHGQTRVVEGTATSVFQVSAPSGGRGFDVAFEWKVTRIRETGSGDFRTYTVDVLASSTNPVRLAAAEDSVSVEATLSQAVEPGDQLGLEISSLNCGSGSCAVSQARAARVLAAALSTGAMSRSTVLATVFQPRRFAERVTTLQKHALAGFGRTMATGIVGGIWQRANAHRSGDFASTARVGGRAIDTAAMSSGDASRVARETARLFGVETVQASRAMTVGADGFLEGASGDLAAWRSRTIIRDGEDLLERSRFSLVVGDDAGGRSLGVWGSGSMSSFESEPEDGASVEGSAQVMLAGIDWRSGEVLAGVALSRLSGDSDYKASSGGQTDMGAVETSLTGVTPYMHWLGPTGLGVWGSFGIGSGTAEMSNSGGAVEADVSMTMLALGAKGASKRRGRYDYAIRGDLFRTSMTAEQAAGFDELAAEASRFRLALEGASNRETGGGGTMSNRFELGARMDSGDGEEGAGADVAGEIRYASADGGLEMAGRVSLLLLHSQEGFSEWGAGLDVAYAPGQSGRGLRLSLEPRWNIPQMGAAESLWSGAAPGAYMDAGSAEEAGASLRARLGYGVGAFGDLALAAPYSEMETGSGERRVQVGVELRGVPESLERFQVNLYGERDETGEAVERRTMLEARLGL